MSRKEGGNEVETKRMQNEADISLGERKKEN